MIATRIPLIAAGDMILRPYDPRPPKKGGRWILLVVVLLGFIFVVVSRAHLNSDDSAATIVTTVTAPSVPPAAAATTADPTATSDDPPAPQASTDPGSIYGITHADALCSALAANPSQDGVMGAAGEAMNSGGLTAYQVGEALATAVYTSCPQFVPLLTAFAHARSTTLA
jgi:hypothetical protein